MEDVKKSSVLSFGIDAILSRGSSQEITDTSSCSDDLSLRSCSVSPPAVAGAEELLQLSQLSPLLQLQLGHQLLLQRLYQPPLNCPSWALPSRSTRQTGGRALPFTTLQLARLEEKYQERSYLSVQERRRSSRSRGERRRRGWRWCPGFSPGCSLLLPTITLSSSEQQPVRTNLETLICTERI